MTTLLRMTQIVKQFPGLLANDHVDFEAWRGEIHGLLGENGAGKTTLMNILYGLYQQEHGAIEFDGQPVHIATPKHALELGIGMVHQHFRLIPRLSVLENIVLGLRPDLPPQFMGAGLAPALRRAWQHAFGLNLNAAEAKVNALAERFGLKIQPHAKVWELSVGEQQRVEIIKALYRNAKLLILDEPTAVLTPQEVDRLFEVLHTMARQGLTIIFITHKLNEVLNLCDRITVLRRGQVVGTVPAAQIGKNELAKMMVGRDVLFDLAKVEAAPGREILNVDRLAVLNDKGLPAVRDFSLRVHAGEILGLAGVSGNGQREFIEAINGLRAIQAGTVTIDGRDVTHASPREIIACGVGYIPEDRLHTGLATTLSMTENMLLKRHALPEFGHGWFLDDAAVKRMTERLVQEFDIRASSVAIPVGRLSGGNIQKIILAREIARNPKLLIASQPTRGLDVGAIEYVQGVLQEQKRQGKAIVLVSENLDETLHLSDRIAVMYEGRLVGTINAPEATRRTIGLMMTGGHA